MSGATLSRLPEVTPCFRWSGLVKKGKAGVLYALEVTGPQGLDELAERLGFSRPRDLRRLYLEPLAEMGLVEDRGGVYRLPGQERYVERVEDIRAARCGGGPRKVRSKDRRGLLVTRVVEVSPKSEVEREEGDRLKYKAESDGYRNRSRGKAPADTHDANSTADGYIGELHLVEEPDQHDEAFSSLAEAVRDYLDKNPSDARQSPYWIGTTLWCYDLFDGKPTAEETGAAIEELGGAAYLEEILKRARGAA